MNPETYRWFRHMQRQFTILSKLPGKLPGSIYLDYVTLSVGVSELAAEHQLKSGFLGQKGSFGGGPWSPQNLEYELEYLGSSTVF